MYFLGLHFVDWLIVAAYLCALIWTGARSRKKIGSTSDFFQAGRSFGRTMMTFLNFGNMVSADQAAGVTSEIYRQGLSGVWFQNLVLFITPFYWFSAVLQRRARYIAPGDIFEHRFRSKFLAGLFAIYLLLTAIYGSALGYLITGKTMQAVLVKPASAYTHAEAAQVHGFERMTQLQHQAEFTPLSDSLSRELHDLTEREKRGEISGVVSYLDLTTFYIIYGSVTALYVMLGGLFAAAYADVLQGVMILILSTILIPVGLAALGGFTGLHSRLGEATFALFGSGAASEYTWYFVLAMVLVNLVGLAPRNFTLGGAAKDDHAARMGMVTGAFAKRIIMIGWALTGLIALALYGGKLSDPTFIWGTMTRELLGTGFIGLMIASVLAANMASKASSSLEWAAAFTKNILLPLKPATTDRMQIGIGRIVILVVLIGGIFFAYVVNDILVVFKYVLSIGTIIGPSLWLVYFWRRLTTKAVVIQMVLSLMVTVVVPNVVPAIPGARDSAALTIQTRGSSEQRITHATTSDVSLGLAKHVGDTVTKTISEPPTGIYFEKVIESKTGQHTGDGIFRFQLWVLGSCGIDLTGFSKAGLSTASFGFDLIFPFIILFLVSLLTRPNDKQALTEFYARVHTPALADAAEDARQVALRVSDPLLIEQDKLFPHSNWEFWKPTRRDAIGFALCWACVAAIVAIYIIMMRIGS